MLFPLILLLALFASFDVSAAKIVDYVEPDKSVLDEVRRQNAVQLRLHDETQLKGNDEQLNKILDARKQLSSPALMEQAKNGTGVNIPFMFDKSASKTLLDTSEKYVSEYEENTQGLEAYGNKTPIVFVSFSMGDELIKRYLEESKKTKSLIVLRGFYKNDMRETMMKIGEMSNKDDPSGLIIDPTLFQRFGVNTVPTFVLPLEPIPRCMTSVQCKTPDHVKAVGDVSIEYFLETVARTGNEQEKEITEQLLFLY